MAFECSSLLSRPTHHNWVVLSFICSKAFKRVRWSFWGLRLAMQTITLPVFVGVDWAGACGGSEKLCTRDTFDFGAPNLLIAQLSNRLFTAMIPSI